MTPITAPKPGVADDTDAPIAHFANCHTGIFVQLARLGDLPALLGPAAQARKVAQASLNFFDKALFNHHTEEEQDLFPAVCKSAQAGAERLKVDGLVAQLTREHRELEKLWKSLMPGLRKVAKGQDSALDVLALESLVQRYQAHARLEEQAFLPLAERILGRHDRHMSALGLSLHMRQVPDFTSYI